MGCHCAHHRTPRPHLSAQLVPPCFNIKPQRNFCHTAACGLHPHMRAALSAGLFVSTRGACCHAHLSFQGAKPFSHGHRHYSQIVGGHHWAGRARAGLGVAGPCPLGWGGQGKHNWFRKGGKHSKKHSKKHITESRLGIDSVPQTRH